jgi:hypothetical protein
VMRQIDDHRIDRDGSQFATAFHACDPALDSDIEYAPNHVRLQGAKWTFATVIVPSAM